MTPKTNEKCYRIHGFTARENVPMDYWLSAGTYVIVAADEVWGSEIISVALDSLYKM